MPTMICVARLAVTVMAGLCLSSRHWSGSHRCICSGEGKPEVAIKQGAGVLSDVAIHHHINGRAHFFVRENGWRGIVLAHDEDEAKLLLEYIHPAQIGRAGR